MCWVDLDQGQRTWSASEAQLLAQPGVLMGVRGWESWVFMDSLSL